MTVPTEPHGPCEPGCILSAPHLAPCEPGPAGPVALSALHLFSQQILHCRQPMTYGHNHTSWTGQHGTGQEHRTTTRTCRTCGATLTLTTDTPS